MFTNAKMSLCNSHDTISYWTRDVKKNLKKAIKDKDYSKLEELIPALNTILEETRVAKKKGLRMEARLQKYRNSIESLGFKRVG
jgi:allophanate hydrolase subunit 1